MPRSSSIEIAKARFWSLVSTPDHGCWIYSGVLNDNGYGRFETCGKKYQAHRLAYKWCKGPITLDNQIDHLCHNRACVRPSHLESVTPQENTRRSAGFGQNLWIPTSHCRHGHEYTPENTYLPPGGSSRQCRACNLIREKKRIRSWPNRSR